MEGRRLEPQPRREGNGSEPTLDARRAKFREQAERRLSDCLDALDFLGALATLRHRFEYTWQPSDVEAVERHLTAKVHEVIDLWKADPKAPRVKLED